MSDAGLVQFMSALGEISHGMNKSSISPVWHKELLNTRDPSRMTCTHDEYEQVSNIKGTIFRSFFFGPTEVAAIRALLPPHQQQHSNFEILTAFLWRCRTIALQPDIEEEVRIICIVNACGKFINPPSPNGYYGNTFAFPAAATTAGKLIENSLGYSLKLVKKAKAEVTQEYMHSVANLMVIKGRPHFTVVRSYLVVDAKHAGFREVDFGWGKPCYGGPAKGGVVSSSYIPFKNARGEEGLVIPVCLPTQAMERFIKELDSVLKNNINQPTMGGPKPIFIISSL